jgi:hypothetical protein
MYIQDLGGRKNSHVEQHTEQGMEDLGKKSVEDSTQYRLLGIVEHRKDRQVVRRMHTDIPDRR